MTDNASSASKRFRGKHDVDKVLDRKGEKLPIIESETEYSQESCDEYTSDAATETWVETDNVHVTADIYSATDLPSSFQTSGEPLRPGVVILECDDGKCAILRTSRSKAVNTDTASSSAEPGLLLKCIFPCIETKEKARPRTIEWSKDNARRSSEADSIQVSRELTLFRRKSNRGIVVKGNLLKCKESCPNLVIDRTSQTSGRIGRGTEPEERCDIGQVDVSVMTSVTLGEVDSERTRAKGAGTPMTSLRSSTHVNLAPIEELEECDAEYEDSSLEKQQEDVETDGSVCTMRDASYASGETSLSTKGQQAWVSDNGDEELEFLTEDDAVEFADRTQDVAIDAPGVGVRVQPLGQKKESAKGSVVRPRRPSSCIFEMGTIISSESIKWVDKPKRRRCREEFYARASESCCGCSRTSDKVSGCPNIAQPSQSNCKVQCEMGSNVASHSMSNQTFCSGPVERYSRCCSCAPRSCNEEPARWRNKNEFSPMDYSTTKNIPSPGSFQGAFMRQQLCRINNAQAGCPITRGPLEMCARNRFSHNNACNPCYLNYNWCNNGYNVRNPNTMCLATRSQMVYQAPHGYYCSFRALY